MTFEQDVRVNVKVKVFAAYSADTDGLVLDEVCGKLTKISCTLISTNLPLFGRVQLH